MCPGMLLQFNIYIIAEWTSKFLENYAINVPVTDANINLLPFCACIEKIFMKGLVTKYNTLGIAKPLHAWIWLEKIKPNNNDRYICASIHAVVKF